MSWKITVRKGPRACLVLLIICSSMACTGRKSPPGEFPLKPVELVEADGMNADSNRQWDVDLVGDVPGFDASDSDVPPMDTSNPKAGWEEFGKGHLLLAVNSNSATHILGTEIHPEEWVSEVKIVLNRAGAPQEILFEVPIVEGPGYGLSRPFTHVVAVAAEEVEDVEICLLAYASENQLRVTVCKEADIRPGTTGQILWQLSAGECTAVDAYCPAPEEETLASLPTDVGVPPVLTLDVVIGEESGTAVLEPAIVVLNLYPPMPCENALQLFHEDVAGPEDESPVKCFDPPDSRYIAGTELHVQLESPEEAIGLVHHVLNMPNGHPVRTLWDEASAGPISEVLFGVSYDEIGTGKAEKPCEWWTCL